ncbi:ORF1 [Birch leaf roll-associated virus]|uniref:ORF1 n=1 Tax=Birch leaf roll-associated virus TaxID=2057979 RepID=A0A2L0W0P1_9VIRU|nr:ORF1 [Birch leaf roll-associated virus]
MSANLSKQPIQGEDDYEEYITNFQRDPRASRLDYLDLVYPKRTELSTTAYTIPCYHREGRLDHSAGHSKTDPALNLLIDLGFGLNDNAAVAYDRAQLFSRYSLQRYNTLEDKLDIVSQQVEELRKEVKELVTVAPSKGEIPKKGHRQPEKESLRSVVDQLEKQITQLQERLSQVLEKEKSLDTNIKEVKDLVRASI